MYSIRYSCPIAMQLESSRQFFGKYSISDFMKVRAVGAELFHADTRTEGWTEWRTVGHGEANSRLSQLCECAYKQLSKM